MKIRPLAAAIGFLAATVAVPVARAIPDAGFPGWRILGDVLPDDASAARPLGAAALDVRLLFPSPSSGLPAPDATFEPLTLLPEASTGFLILLGLLGLAAAGRRPAPESRQRTRAD